MIVYLDLNQSMKLLQESLRFSHEVCLTTNCVRVCRTASSALINDRRSFFLGNNRIRKSLCIWEKFEIVHANTQYCGFQLRVKLTLEKSAAQWVHTAHVHINATAKTLLDFSNNSNLNLLRWRDLGAVFTFSVFFHDFLKIAWRWASFYPRNSLSWTYQDKSKRAVDCLKGWKISCIAIIVVFGENLIDSNNGTTNYVPALISR